MSYTVLARRYRSATFDEVVGQEAIATTLKNAIEANRVAHAYLFCGTRGVGKTSMARILAKALNCEKGPTPTPCCKCEICESIALGEDIDVIEIDGASNTGVDNIRELRSNAIYRPARARFKIYIIDEVHMISVSAFNALLKTLEEPPEHVKFIFATTEPNRVPVTIQSRCQRFDFRPIPADRIAEHLRTILKKEKVKADDSVIRRIAQLANGSIRDGLSLLDQLLSLGLSKLTAETMEQFMPTPSLDSLGELVDAFIATQAGKALTVCDGILAAGYSLTDFCSSLTMYLRDLMILRACGEEGVKLLHSPETAHEKMRQQANACDATTWIYAITVMEELARSIRYSDCARALVDAAMARLGSMSKVSDIAELVSQLGGESGEPAASAGGSAARPSAAPVSAGGAVKKKSPPLSQGSFSPSVGERESRGPAAAKNMYAATAEPVVRHVLEVFEGRVVDIRKARKK